MKRVLPLILLLVADSAFAGDLKIVGETKVPAHRLVRLEASGAEPDAAILWDVIPEEVADVEERDGKLWFVAPPGQYKIKLRTIKGKAVQTARATVTIGDGDPTPGPQPPGPGPQPPPPSPAAPIAAPGFRVLIVYQDQMPLPLAQHSVIYGQAMRNYLNAKCPREPSGQASYRIWDADLDVSQSPKHYQDAYNRVRLRQLPYLVVSNGTTGWEGPLPASEAETLAILKHFGGE